MNFCSKIITFIIKKETTQEKAQCFTVKQHLAPPNIFLLSKIGIEHSLQGHFLRASRRKVCLAKLLPFQVIIQAKGNKFCFISHYDNFTLSSFLLFFISILFLCGLEENYCV